MQKIFKYSVLALQHPEDERSFEFSFEEDHVIRENDSRCFDIGHSSVPFTIVSVRKVDHILSPNDPFDYRLFAMGSH